MCVAVKTCRPERGGAGILRLNEGGCKFLFHAGLRVDEACVGVRRARAGVARYGSVRECFRRAAARTVIGTSQDGAPLTLYQLGEGSRRVLLIGGQHGGPEENTVELASGLLEYFSRNPAEVPPGIELDILPVANPDGLGTRRSPVC